jgi:hypothetical protein
MDFDDSLLNRFNEMLPLAEQTFGPRVPYFDRDGQQIPWTFDGVDYQTNPQSPPVVFFPHIKSTKTISGAIRIRLAKSSFNDEPKACYEMAHECVHFLSPSVTQDEVDNTSILEEGAATQFAIEYMKLTFPLYPFTYHPRYTLAFALVQELLHINPNAINQLRTQTRNPRYFREITAQDLLDVASGLSAHVANLLVEPFSVLKGQGGPQGATGPTGSGTSGPGMLGPK